MRACLLLLCLAGANALTADRARADWRDDWRAKHARPRGAPATPVADARQPEAPRHGATGVALGPHLGIATPYGLVGAAVDARLSDVFAIEVGSGYALARGIQFACMPRLRIPHPDSAATFGIGASWGPYQASDEEGGLLTVFNSMGHASYSTVTWRMAYWLNAEIGVEMADGKALERLYFGYGGILNDYDRCDATGPDDQCPRGFGVLYVGFSLSWMLF